MKSYLLKPIHRVLIVFTAVLLMTVSPVYATKLKQQNLSQLIAESQSIIAGTVKRVVDGIDDRNMPYTEVTIAVHSTAKGKVTEQSEYTFRQFGLLKPRKLANGHQLLAVTPEGFPSWHEGEYAVAFLYQPARITGLQTTAGLTQGKFNLINGKLVNEFNNIGLFNGVEVNPALLNPAEMSLLATESGAVDAATFMALVGRAVAGQWVENGEMK